MLRSMLALLLIGFVLSGLLSFPTSCACGAAVPHAHALFELSGHHHDTDHHHSHQTQDVEAKEATRSEKIHYSVQSSKSSSANSQIASSIGRDDNPLSLAGLKWSMSRQTTNLPAEWIDNTDIPPPRAHPIVDRL